MTTLRSSLSMYIFLYTGNKFFLVAFLLTDFFVFSTLYYEVSRNRLPVLHDVQARK
jgi:hypothetical protein